MIKGICIGIIAAVFSGDLRIKNYIEKTGTEGVTKSACKGKVLIRRHHNRGLALNVGQSRQMLVAALSVVMTLAAFVCFVISLGQKGNNILRIGLSMLLGGAFSNTYDRLKRKYVVDYFSFGVKWKKLRSIVFNLSDFFIIIGAVISAIGVGK